MENPALEQAIRANPDDRDAYMVYADWLQSQGDPRGELIALQTAGSPTALKYLDAHAAAFLGPLVEHQLCYDGYRNQRKPAFTWKHGFIRSVRLAHNKYATDWKGSLAADVLAPLLQHPSGKLVTELTLNDNNDPSEDTLDELFAVIAKYGIPTLRKLQIGDDVPQISWYHVGNLGPIWKAVPNLRELEIEAGSFELGTIDAPRLERAVFRTGGLSRSSMRSIATATWPNLVHLEVYFGDPNYGGECSTEDVAPLLARTDLRALKYLGVKNAPFEDELVPVLARSPLVAQVETLDLADGILTDGALDAFEAHADAFRHLVLDVTDTYLSEAAVERLRGIARRVDAGNLREDNDPEYRYVCVGE